MPQEANQLVSFIFDSEAKMAQSSGYREEDRWKLFYVKATKTFKILVEPSTGEFVNVGGVGTGAVEVLAYPYTAAAIQNAINAVVATGLPGKVVHAPVDYDFSLSGYTPADNVSMFGLPYLRKPNGDIPDSDMQVSKGTRYINGPGITSINFNTVDQPALPAAGTLGATGLYKCNFEGLTSIGGVGLMKIGAQNLLGAQECYFNDLYYFDATGWGIELHNFMQCTFGNLRGRNGIKGGGIRYAVTMGARTYGPGNSAVLIPGNSTWQGTSFIFTSHISGRGYEWFGRSTTEATQLNEIHAEGAKFQVNRFPGSSTPPTINLQITANNPDIFVPSQAEYELLIETGAMSLIAGAPSAMGTTDTYFIVSKDDVNKTIRLQTSILPNSFVTPTSGGNFTASYGGPPGLCVNFDTLSLVTSSHLGMYDIELQGNICSVYGRRLRSTVFGVAEMYNTYHRGALVLRDSIVKAKFKTTAAVGYCNFDSNTHLNLECEPAGPKVITTGFTLQKSDHGNTYIVNSASAVDIVWPAGLNQRFWIRVLRKGAGQVNIIPGAGVTPPAVTGTSGALAIIEARATHGTSDQYDVFGQAA